MRTESGLEDEQKGPKEMILYKMRALGVGVEDKRFAYIKSFEKIRFKAAL